ncbi:serine protease [Mesorhizobium sp. SEMIA 3007]|uniref:S1 family peptidase n=1 Tax=Mesorhizobium sp. SEMIA 3007 TaxID=1862350 RepID=UPI001495E26D|nr:serine protease [Mesorhizobium sp. SEMIA 3007]
MFQIAYGQGTGTAFTIDFNGNEYLVTAAHVIPKIKNGDPIYIRRGSEWVEHPVLWVSKAEGDLDVAVLQIGAKLTPKDLPALASKADMIYGQEVYFLGFPFGWVGHFHTHDGYPLPFVKRATASLFDPLLLYLDGHNNPGFSGGPVVFRPPNQNDFRIASIISGYRTATEKIKIGEVVTEFSTNVNTGIIHSYNIEIALELLEAQGSKGTG